MLSLVVRQVGEVVPERLSAFVYGNLSVAAGGGALDETVEALLRALGSGLRRLGDVAGGDSRLGCKVRVGQLISHVSKKCHSLDLNLK